MVGNFDTSIRLRDSVESLRGKTIISRENKAVCEIGGVVANAIFQIHQIEVSELNEVQRKISCEINEITSILDISDIQIGVGSQFFGLIEKPGYYTLFLASPDNPNKDRSVANISVKLRIIGHET